jgi:putative transposase
MPEHVHLLMSEPPGSNPSIALQVLKQEVSRKLRKEDKRVSSARSQPGEDHFWQRRFYDFNVWTENKFKEKLEYMHANPVNRGLVGLPKDWPWSSWGHYTGGEKGLIPVDTLGDRVADN